MSPDLEFLKAGSSGMCEKSACIEYVQNDSKNEAPQIKAAFVGDLLDVLNSMLVTNQMKAFSSRKPSVFSNQQSDKESVLMQKLDDLEGKMDSLQTENFLLQQQVVSTF